MSYTVESVVSQESWTGRDGKGFVAYELMLQGEGQTVTLNKLATSQAPSAGDTLDGTIESGPRGRKLTLTRRNGGERRSGGGKDYARQPDHPIQMQRALHTSALSTAIPLIEQMLTIGVMEQPKDLDAYKRTVVAVADWVQSTYPTPVLDQAAKADT